jgi:hypothetical protein
LKQRGYTAEADFADTIDDHALVVELPRAQFSDAAIENLRKIVAAKQTLIKKALGADSLPIEIDTEKLQFPWFTLTGIDGEVDAYTHFVSAICKMAKTQKRVTAREREVTNDKFTMRLFLIRMGFIGSEFKATRKILLRNLTGNSSWKSGGRPERANVQRNNEEVEICEK